MVFRIKGCSESPALRWSHVNFGTIILIVLMCQSSKIELQIFLAKFCIKPVKSYTFAIEFTLNTICPRSLVHFYIANQAVVIQGK